MADQKFVNCCIFMKMSILMFLQVLSSNLKTELQNSSWRIQYSSSNIFKSFDFLIFHLRYWILKFCHQIWIQKSQKAK